MFHAYIRKFDVINTIGKFLRTKQDLRLWDLQRGRPPPVQGRGSAAVGRRAVESLRVGPTRVGPTWQWPNYRRGNYSGSCSPVQYTSKPATSSGPARVHQSFRAASEEHHGINHLLGYLSTHSFELVHPFPCSPVPSSTHQVAPPVPASPRPPPLVRNGI
jgi:hypothetical protein